MCVHGNSCVPGCKHRGHGTANRDAFCTSETRIVFSYCGNYLNVHIRLIASYGELLREVSWLFLFLSPLSHQNPFNIFYFGSIVMGWTESGPALLSSISHQSINTNISYMKMPQQALISFPLYFLQLLSTSCIKEVLILQIPVRAIRHLSGFTGST